MIKNVTEQNLTHNIHVTPMISLRLPASTMRRTFQVAATGSVCVVVFISVQFYLIHHASDKLVSAGGEVRRTRRHIPKLIHQTWKTKDEAEIAPDIMVN